MQPDAEPRSLPPQGMATGSIKGAQQRRYLVAAFGDAGHAFPAISLAEELSSRGHDVVLETWKSWREPVEALGVRFAPAEEYVVFPPPPPGINAGAGEAAHALLPLLDDFRPDVVISDILTLAPTLAAELRDIPHASLIPHLYPVHEPGLPFFGVGAALPRTKLGKRAWRAALPVLETGLRRGRAELNEIRAGIGLPPLDRFHGGLSERLQIVGTFPQLEYPRRWPAAVQLCGPLDFELPHPDIELPAGADPIVLIASSTAQDPQCELIRRCFSALADEPLRVIASTNGHQPAEPIAVPGNGTLVDWLSYSQLMPASSLVICHGGHGTVCRALQAGRPLLVSPSVGDMAENAERVHRAGAGLTVPRRLRREGPIRAAVRTLIDDPRYRLRAEEIGSSASAAGGAGRAAAAIEREFPAPR